MGARDPALHLATRGVPKRVRHNWLHGAALLTARFQFEKPAKISKIAKGEERGSRCALRRVNIFDAGYLLQALSVLVVEITKLCRSAPTPKLH